MARKKPKPELVERPEAAELFTLTLGMNLDPCKNPQYQEILSRDQSYRDLVRRSHALFRDATPLQRRNQTRQQQAQNDYAHYRAAADEIKQECPRLASKGKISQLAKVVQARLKLPNKRWRTIRRVLSQK